MSKRRKLRAAREAQRRRLRYILAVLALLVAAAGAFSIWRGRAVDQFDHLAEARAAIRNVLIISLDTTRADYLGCYGFPQPTTPVIDALAAEGVLCELAISPVPMTLPAHCSLLTGNNPPRHGVRQNIKYRLPPASTTLAELLQGEGLATGAIVSAGVISASFGLDQGFDTYHDRFEGAERKAEETSRLAIQWLEAYQQRPFFLFLHYFDPHAPFEPPGDYANRFGNQPHADYAGEVAYTDACIGRVIAKLKTLDLLESTLIVVVGDHGESLGEHGERLHSYYVYQCVQHVPLVLRIPGYKGVRKLSEPVGLIDVVPTICALLDVDAPADLDGHDLTPLLGPDKPPASERAIYCESMTPTVYGCNPLFGLVSARWKYIESTQPELYDLTVDPHETENLLGTTDHAYEARVADMHDLLAEMLRDTATASEDLAVDLDEQELRRLQSLGYVGSQVDDTAVLADDKVDARERLGYHRQNMEAGRFMGAGQLETAAQVARQMIDQHPELFHGYQHLADIAMMQQDLPRAISLSRKVLQLEPENPESHYRLAVALHRRGATRESIEHYRATLAVQPGKGEAHLNLGLALKAVGETDQAMRHFRRAVQINPEDLAAREQLKSSQRMPRSPGRTP